VKGLYVKECYSIFVRAVCFVNGAFLLILLSTVGSITIDDCDFYVSTADIAAADATDIYELRSQCGSHLITSEIF